MTIRIVRLGTPRAPSEGPRLGTVRRPPRGVRKEDFAARDYFDVWLPELAPTAPLVSWLLSEPVTPERWAAFEPIRDNMVALCALYRGNGYAGARYTPGTYLPQGEDFALADIAWEIDWSDKPSSRFNTTYNLMRTADGWRVLLCTAYSEKRLQPPAVS